MPECKSRAHVAVMFAFLTGAANVAGAATEPPRLDLVWIDPTDIATGTFATVAAESRALLAATGAEVTWTAAPRGAVVGPESLVVIAIPTYPRSLGRERHVMGSTRMVADGALAVWVFPDQVAWALGLDLEMRRSWGMRAEKSFGIALARVASHEVIHALGASSHSPGGLMAARLDRNALTATTLRIDGATVAAIRRSFDRGARMADRSWTPSLLRGGPFTAAAELLATPGSSR
jgi:hypothetical protein